MFDGDLHPNLRIDLWLHPQVKSAIKEQEARWILTRADHRVENVYSSVQPLSRV